MVEKLENIAGTYKTNATLKAEIDGKYLKELSMPKDTYPRSVEYDCDSGDSCDGDGGCDGGSCDGSDGGCDGSSCDGSD